MVEGVSGKITSTVTLSYRIAARFGRGGLVMQGKARDLSAHPEKLIRPDLSATQFRSGWKLLSLPVRLLTLTLSPLFGIWLLIVGPRRMFTTFDQNIEDLPSKQEDEMAGSSLTSLDDLILGTRDRALCESLLELTRESSDQTIGVCWGALHVRAVMRLLLHELDYRVVASEWLTISAW